jgi:predicted kinase
VRRYLAGREPLLAERIAQGRVVDGHGDLLADDIFCVDDGPRILDCLEFDDRLRWGDVIYDVGFLAMDLERLGRGDLARAFLDWYRELSAETHPRSLEHHYIAYRALVRAKVSCLKGGLDDRLEAGAYLAQCHRHLRAGRVRLVVVGGLPGTGKTTVSNGIGQSLGWPVLSSDELRKQDAGLDVRDHAAAAYGAGLYTPAIVDATYGRLLSRARTLLEHGESVVLDASFAQPRWRSGAAAMALEAHADLVELRCELPTEVAAGRLAERIRDRTDASDADPEIARAMAGSFATWPSALGVDTALSPPDVMRQVLGAVAGDEV